MTQRRDKSNLKGVGPGHGGGPVKLTQGLGMGQARVCVRGQGPPCIGGECRKRGGKSEGNQSSLVTTSD